jgi:tetratricopeptide (TPR) repeat protein
MSAKDRFGLAVAGASPRALEAIDGFHEQWLGFGRNFAPIVELADAEPGCPLPRLMAAMLNLAMDSPDGIAAARRQLAKARDQVALMGEREGLWLAALEAWSDGDIARAGDLHATIAESFPRDLSSAKIGIIHRFMCGDADGMLRLADRMFAASRDIAYAWGMRAFALEESHRLAEAEEHGRRAVEMQRGEPWAHHAVAHVMEAQGRLDEGIAWMEGLADTWEACNSFMYTHNWWHTALFHLDRENAGRALELFDTRVWGVWKEFAQDQINAVSLLARLEIRGLDVGARWRDVAHYLLPRLHEHISPFLDLQYLYGIARAGERAAVTEMLASLETHAEQARGPARRAWRDAAVPAAHGLAAHAAGDWAGAAQHLSQALPHLGAIGGSHAQRALFGLIHLDALVRAEWNDRAFDLLRAAERERGNIPWVKRWLAEICRRLGRGEDAFAADWQAADLERRYHGGLAA